MKLPPIFNDYTFRICLVIGILVVTIVCPVLLVIFGVCYFVFLMYMFMSGK